MSPLEACQYGVWRPWHAYDPLDPFEVTLCGRPIARARRLWQPWIEQYESGRCKQCARKAMEMGH